MMPRIADIANADLIVGFSPDGMRVIKDRHGDQGTSIDLPKLLELIMPFQEEYCHPLISALIDKLKVYRPFK